VVQLPGIRLLQVEPLVVPPDGPVGGPFPDITSLSWIEQGMEHNFDLLPSEFFGEIEFFEGMDQAISYFESLQKSPI